MHALFESQLADILINAGTALIYITGLVCCVAWLERNKAKRLTAITKSY